MNRRIEKFVLSMAFSLSVLPLAHAAPGDGVPFQQLQQQVDALKAQVNALAEQVGGGGGGDQMVAVNCPGDTIGGALAQAKPGGALIVTVTGTCTEDVTIARNDVTLQGGAQVVGQITVDGAQRILINGLKVTGPGSGIEAHSNAAITVTNSTIENNALAGIAVRHGAFAVIDGNVIRNNARCDVLARDSGSAQVGNNTIEASQAKSASCPALVGVFRNSFIRLIGGNTISAPPNPGPFPGPSYALLIQAVSTVRQDGGHDTITGDVLVLSQASADLRDVNLTGFVAAVENANFQTRNSTITGSITIGSRSLAVFAPPASTVDGVVSCQGSATVGLVPVQALTLRDSQLGPVTTSAGGLGWAFRGAVFGAPNFSGGGFNGCN